MNNQIRCRATHFDTKIPAPLFSTLYPITAFGFDLRGLCLC